MAEHPWVVVAMNQAQRNLVPAERRIADLETIQTDLLQTVRFQVQRLDEQRETIGVLTARIADMEARIHRLASLIRSVEAGGFR
jgi:hypothetical protein